MYHGQCENCEYRKVFWSVSESDTVTLSQTKQELANEQDHFQWFSNRSIEMFDKELV